MFEAYVCHQLWETKVYHQLAFKDSPPVGLGVIIPTVAWGGSKVQRPTHQGKPCTWHGRHDSFRETSWEDERCICHGETHVLYNADSPIRSVSNGTFLWLKKYWLVAGCFLKLCLAKSSPFSFLDNNNIAFVLTI